MAQLFTQLDESAARAARERARAELGEDVAVDEGTRWGVTPLTVGPYELGEGLERAVVVRTTDESRQEQWLLFAPAGAPSQVVRGSAAFPSASAFVCSPTGTSSASAATRHASSSRTSRCRRSARTPAPQAPTVPVASS